MRISLFIIAAFGLASPAKADDAPVDFGKQIRPILNQHCVGCHGGIKEAGELSFIYREEALAVIVPGEPDDSDLIDRITTDDSEMRMPPVDEHPDGLEPHDIELLRLWITQGASWSGHWAFEKPERQKPPTLTDTGWPRQPVDHFILARLESEGIKTSAPAPAEQWLRRASLDLIGLPPSLQELDQFLNESIVDPKEAVERQVERLLNSPHFGERWAQMWLDLVRYSDTMGYEKDLPRTVWPYRDWLIRAFNEDLPFDQFTIKQIAGDLLPNSTADDLVATVCHRNTQTNTEGGTDDEEFRVAAVIDRVNTTWTVWHGLTFGCVQCHSHPYDPFRHEDYYRFMAFFNNTEDCDLKSEFPVFEYPENREDLPEAYRLRKELLRIRRQLNDEVKNLLLKDPTDWIKLTNPKLKTSQGGIRLDQDGHIRVTGTLPQNLKLSIEVPAVPTTAIRVQIFPETDAPDKRPERGAVITQMILTLIQANGEKRELTVNDVIADTLSGPFDPIEATRKSKSGFGGYPKLVRPRWAVFLLAEPLSPPADSTLQIAIRSSASTTGNQPTPVRRFTIETTGETRWSRLASSTARRAKWQRYRELDKSLKALLSVAVPVMVERPPENARKTRLFIRGNWIDQDALVESGTPSVLHAKDSKPKTRLDLAKWMVHPDNPLTARVFVNRVWAELFGIGIVETLGDFGSSGEQPVHPELLDDLAIRFQSELGWSLKSLLRELVLSATYRQDNRVTARQLEVDPRNRLLSRGPRTRLSAEMVRDQALSASGLLARTPFGPPVMPPQPDGVWSGSFTGSDRQWKTSDGKDLYRRAIYTYWKRTAPYPSFITFDAPAREVCSPRRIATNTPLQALVTLNDPVYVEAARALGQRMSKSGIANGYRAVILDQPDQATLGELEQLYEDALEELQSTSFSKNQTLGATPREAALTLTANVILNLDSAMTK